MKTPVRKYLLLLIAAALLGDIVTKWYIREHFDYLESVSVIDGFFNIVYVLNPGAAFGFLRNMDPSYRQIFFIVVSLAAITGVGYLLFREKRSFPAAAYALVIAGACGNLIDRIRSGYVVDFLDFRLGSYAWPAFNVADVCITIGIFMLIADVISGKRDEKKSHSSEKAVR